MDAPDLESISDRGRAVALLHPIRLAIMRLAREPLSASEMGARLALSRQRVNYHVRRLAGAGLLRRAARKRKRNMVEQQYVASARAFVLDPDLLGEVGADWRRIPDTAGVPYLLALLGRVQADVSRCLRAPAGPEPLPALSLKSQLRFEGPTERGRFLEDLRTAIAEVVARHTLPESRRGRPSSGRVYRMVLGCYPYLPEAEPGPNPR